MAAMPNGISVSVQYEHLHTISLQPFFIGLGIGLSLCQCERTVTLRILMELANGFGSLFPAESRTNDIEISL